MADYNYLYFNEILSRSVNGYDKITSINISHCSLITYHLKLIRVNEKQNPFKPKQVNNLIKRYKQYIAAI